MQDKIIRTELDRVLAVPGLSGGDGGQIGVVVQNASIGTATTPGAEVTAAAQNSLIDAIALSTAQLAEVRATVEGQLASLTENTRALADNTSAKSAGAVLGRAGGSLLNNVLGGGLLGPIISGVMDLFGGESNQTETSITKYALPSPVSFTAGLQNGTMTGADYGADGLPRAMNAGSSTPAQQVTVNINTIDSRSFLDHSNEIASAVRRAMLESSSLNDVIGEV